VLQGEQPPVVDRALFDAVQAKLEEQNNNHKTTRAKSEASLAGRIFDDRGNRMSPSHSRKRGIKYRYYLSSALLDGRPTKAGAVSRVSAAEIETVVVKAVRERLKLEEPHDPGSIVKSHVTRVEVQADHLTIQLTPSQNLKRGRPSADSIIRVPWCKAPPRRRREVLLPADETRLTTDVKPIRSETRATLVAAIARGRRWLDQMSADPKVTTESIATTERCSSRRSKRRSRSHSSRPIS